ncbi:FRG domain-containing protein [Xanthomonas bromi]|uniref:FRG domain-containing protein n=1 Tax=Xanthomonas bromi TaxID=56449 RepID=A0ABX5BRG4_9XANT|nr:FRG domain-containing protein [Xanthomonas bromi]
MFRGQSRAEWKLETTLERFGKKDLSLEEYARYLARVKPGIEAYTDRLFEFNLGNQRVPGSTFPLSQISLLAGQYEFMVYLRHHGFPTPLLDWSRSLYVALFFACSGQDHQDDSALYMYVENLGFGKGGMVGSPEIATLGQYVTAHKRHFIQQSEYTACIGKFDGEWCFSQHESAMGGVAGRQDRLEKFVIPAELRRSILRQLDAMNINPFSLFGTEESLMQMLAFREISD